MKALNTKFTLALLAAVSLGLFGLLAFSWLHLRSESREIGALLVSATEGERREAEEQAIRAARNEAAPDIAAFDGLTLNNERLIPLIEGLEAAGRALGLELVIDSVDKKAGEGGAPELVRLSVNAKGSWGNAYAFLKAVESLPYRVMIERAELSKNPSGWEEDIVFSLHLFP